MKKRTWKSVKPGSVMACVPAQRHFIVEGMEPNSFLGGHLLLGYIARAVAARTPKTVPVCIWMRAFANPLLGGEWMSITLTARNIKDGSAKARCNSREHPPAGTITLNAFALIAQAINP